MLKNFEINSLEITKYLSKNIKVEYEYTDLQLTVAIDENLFRQIIINLIEKYESICTSYTSNK